MTELLSELSSGWTPWAVILAGLLVLFVAVFRPWIALAVALALLYNPYYVYNYLILRFEEGAGIRALASIAFVTAIAFGMFLRNTVRSSSRVSRTTGDIPLLLLLPLILIGFARAVMSEAETRQALADCFPVLEFAGYFFLGARILQSRLEVRAFLWVLILGGAMSSVVITFLFAQVGSDVALPVFRIQGQAAIQRLNDFMGIVFLPLSLSLLAWERGWRRLVLCACAGAFLVAILLGFWRSQWAALAASVLFLIWVARRFHSGLKPRWIVLGGLVGILSLGSLAAAAVNLPLSLPKAVGARLSESPAQAFRQVRTSETARLIEITLENPLLGTGAGNDFVAPSYWPPFTDVVRPLGAAHNYFLSLAAQFGIPAVALLFLVAIRFFRQGLSVLDSAQDIRAAAAVGTLGALVSVAVASSLSPNLLHFPALATLGSLSGSLMRYASSRRAPVRVVPGYQSGHELTLTRNAQLFRA